MSNSHSFGRNESLALNSTTFKEFNGTQFVDGMTMGGAVIKTGILLAIVIASAAWSWLSISHNAGVSGLSGWLVLAILTAFGVGMVTVIAKQAAPFTAPIYALLEGAVLGGVSAIFEAYQPGTVLQAMMLTFGVLLNMLALYAFGIVKVTTSFNRGVIAATGAIVLLYLVTTILRIVLGLGAIRFD